MFYLPDSTHWGLNYNGSVLFYSRYPSNYNTSHSLAFYYLIPFDENETNSLELFSTIQGRLDGPENKYYDNYQLLSNLSYNHSFNDEVTTLETGYQARYRNYSNLPNLSYIENSIFAKFKTSLPTKTSFTANINFGDKIYQTSGYDIIYEKGYQKRIIRHMGPPHGKIWDTILIPVAVTKEISKNDNTTSQLVATLKTAQSVGKKTGISVIFSQRWDLKPNQRSIGYLLSGYNMLPEKASSENELFDDPYSYQSSELTIGLTSLIIFDIKMIINAFYYKKTYSQPANSYIVNDTASTIVNSILSKMSQDKRRDDLRGITLSLSKTFNLSENFLDEITLSFDFIHENNSSNGKGYIVEASPNNLPFVGLVYTNNYISNSYYFGISLGF